MSVDLSYYSKYFKRLRKTLAISKENIITSKEILEKLHKICKYTYSFIRNCCDLWKSPKSLTADSSSPSIKTKTRGRKSWGSCSFHKRFILKILVTNSLYNIFAGSYISHFQSMCGFNLVFFVDFFDVDKVWIRMYLIPLKQQFYVLLLRNCSLKSALGKISYT